MSNQSKPKRRSFFNLNTSVLFPSRSQYTAPGPAESLRTARAGVRLVSFSEVRRNLSGKAGKRGGEIWPPSQISSGHGGEVLQEFTVVCTIRPFFPSFCFSSCHRRNKKLFPIPPSASLQVLGRNPPSKNRPISPQPMKRSPIYFLSFFSFFPFLNLSINFFFFGATGTAPPRMLLISVI